VAVAGEAEEVCDYFAPGFVFHAPSGRESDYAGLAAYLESLRNAVEDRSIRRGVVVVGGNTIASQTWIQGTFVLSSRSLP
jgi:hypothetical protein